MQNSATGKIQLPIYSICKKKRADGCNLEINNIAAFVPAKY